jgi:hypothetical protein
VSCLHRRGTGLTEIGSLRHRSAPVPRIGFSPAVEGSLAEHHYRSGRNRESNVRQDYLPVLIFAAGNFLCLGLREIVTVYLGPTTARNCLTPPRILGDNAGSIQ